MRIQFLSLLKFNHLCAGESHQTSGWSVDRGASWWPAGLPRARLQPGRPRRLRQQPAQIVHFHRLSGQLGGGNICRCHDISAKHFFVLMWSTSFYRTYESPGNRQAELIRKPSLVLHCRLGRGLKTKSWNIKTRIAELGVFIHKFAIENDPKP